MAASQEIIKKQPSGTIEQQEKDNMKQYWLLLLGVSVFGFGTLGLYKPILAPYLKSLGFGASVIGFTIGLMGLSKSLTNIPAGYLSDKYGRKPVMIVGLVIFGICYPFYMFSKNIIVLSIARLLNGLGNSAAAQPSMTSVADLLKKKRAFGMGCFESLNYISISATTLLAGWLAVNYGMTSPFYLGLPMCLIGAFIIHKFVKETKPAAASREKPEPDEKPESKSAPESAEYKSSWDVWKKMLVNPGFSTMCYLGFITKMVDEGILITLIPLVAASYGLGVGEIAGIIAIGYVTFSMIQPLTGYVSDRIGRRPAFILGLILLSTSAIVFPYAKTYILFASIVILMKVGNAMLYPSLPAAAADVSPVKFRSTGVSIYRTFRDAGVFGGPLIAGVTLEFLGRGNAFYFVAAMFIIGLLLTLVFVKETIQRADAH
jgi:MFS family permease